MPPLRCIREFAPIFFLLLVSCSSQGATQSGHLSTSDLEQIGIASFRAVGLVLDGDREELAVIVPWSVVDWFTERSCSTRSSSSRMPRAEVSDEDSQEARQLLELRKAQEELRMDAAADPAECELLLRSLKARLPGLEEGLFADYVALNKQPSVSLIGQMMSVVKPAGTLPLSDAGAVALNSATDWWRAFHEHFPSAKWVVSSSRVGLSTDGLRAFLYIEKQSSRSNGEGHFVVLTKGDGRWSVLASHRTHIL